MFKRVQKRVRKQQKEEELGLDSEMKEVLGLQDTDSEESDSSSSESGSDSEEGSEDESSPVNREDVEEDEDTEEDEEEDDDTGSIGGEDESEFPPMSVTEAVSDPLYYLSTDSDVRACILCPGKLLKNPRMADVHKSSKAHNRRFTRFVDLVSKAGPDGDVRDLIRQLNDESRAQVEPKAKEGGLSKRAEKRKAKLAAVKARRERHKEIVKRKRKQAKAKASAGASKPLATASDEPARKKRKMDNGGAEEPVVKSDNNPIAQQSKAKAKDSKPTRNPEQSKVRDAGDSAKPTKTEAGAQDKQSPAAPRKTNTKSTPKVGKTAEASPARVAPTPVQSKEPSKPASTAGKEKKKREKKIVA